MNNITELKKDRVIAIDTDSIYLDLSDLVEKYQPKSPIDFMDKVCSKKIEPVLEKAYDELYNKMNAMTNRMEMGREVLADRAIWTAKKHYIINVYDNEGVRYSEPKLKIQGMESIKSSTPMVVRKKFNEAYKLILMGNEKDLQKYVIDFYNEFKSLEPEDVAFPRGVSDIDKWTVGNNEYKKGTPIHVRGSILYNKMLDKKGINGAYEYIKNGSKIKFTYMKVPNVLRENVFAFPQFLPREFGLNEFVDYDKQFDKSFKEPLRQITDVIGWNLEKKATLQDLFV